MAAQHNISTRKLRLVILSLLLVAMPSKANATARVTPVLPLPKAESLCVGIVADICEKIPGKCPRDQRSEVSSMRPAEAKIRDSATMIVNGQALVNETSGGYVVAFHDLSTNEGKYFPNPKSVYFCPSSKKLDPKNGVYRFDLPQLSSELRRLEQYLENQGCNEAIANALDACIGQFRSIDDPKDSMAEKVKNLKSTFKCGSPLRDTTPRPPSKKQGSDGQNIS